MFKNIYTTVKLGWSSKKAMLTTIRYTYISSPRVIFALGKYILERSSWLKKKKCPQKLEMMLLMLFLIWWQALQESGKISVIDQRRNLMALNFDPLWLGMLPYYLATDMLLNVTFCRRVLISNSCYVFSSQVDISWHNSLPCQWKN